MNVPQVGRDGKGGGGRSEVIAESGDERLVRGKWTRPVDRVCAVDLEAIAQPTERPLPDGHRGLPRQTKDAGQLGVGEIGEVAQDQGMSVSRTQGTERAANLVALGVRLTGTKRRRKMP